MMKNLLWMVSLTLAGMTPAWADAVPDSRYLIQGAEVYDTVQNLTWQRCSVGQTWKESGGCAGAPKTLTFQDAQQQATGKWRVPTKDELASLIDHGREDFPTTDKAVFPDMSESVPAYWSSTPDGSDRAWNVRFTSGGIVDDVIGYRFAVRLVRSGK